MTEPHVTAVEATLSNDWETRLSLEVQCLGDPDTWNDAQCLRVQRLIAGNNAKELPNMDQVRSVFCSPVLSALSHVGRHLSSRAENGVTWRAEVEDPPMLTDLESWMRLSAQHASIFEETFFCIRRSLSRRSFHTGSVRLIKHASSWNNGWSVRDGTPELRRRNGIIRPSSVVQALTKGNGGIQEATSDICELCTFAENTQSQAGLFSVTYWYVLGVFEAESTPSCFPLVPYALVVPCKNVPGFASWHVPMQVDLSARVSILPLSPCVRETLCIHACDVTKQCRVNVRNCVEHNGTVGTGSSFYIFGRHAGYPPRIG